MRALSSQNKACSLLTLYHFYQHQVVLDGKHELAVQHFHLLFKQAPF